MISRSNVESILYDLMQLPIDERGAHLAELSLEEAERTQVEEWLPYLDSVSRSDFLDKPVQVEALLDRLEEEAANGVPVQPQPSGGVLPRQLGQYTLLALIAQGGMGRVYRAQQPNPKRLVAIKQLRPGLATEEHLERFRFESKVLAQLEHPGIAQIIEANSGGDGPDAQPYFVMEFVDGMPMDEFCRGLAIRRRVELFTLVCDAVEHAHLRGVVHRDLKPANILINADGFPCVLDFGVARAVDSDLQASTMLTTPGELVGTIRYMSPEQARGESEKIDSRCDIYSLGVILFELLYGQHPLGQSESTNWIELIRAIQSDESPRLGRVAPALRGDLDAIVAKAMAREPDQRYTTAGELRADLQRYLNGHAVEARDGQAAYQIRRFLRRHWALTGSVSILLVAMFLALLGLGALFIRLSKPSFVTIEPGGRTATLRSSAGNPLYVWDGSEERAIVNRYVLETPRGPEVLLQYGPDMDGEHSGQIVAYSFDDPERPIWSTADPPLTPPQPFIDHSGSPWLIRGVQLVDCFAECPGSEVVVNQRWGIYSASVVRVFDSEGRLRYQAWHDGVIHALQWDPSLRRFYVAIQSSEKRWIERGFDLGENEYAAGVFSCEPKLDHLGDQWVVFAGQRLDPTLLWYKWLGPADKLPNTGNISPSLGRFQADEAVGGPRCHVNFRLDVVGVAKSESVYRQLYMFLDADGNEFRERRHAGDRYDSDHRRGELPSPAVYEWLNYEDLPTGPQ